MEMSVREARAKFSHALAAAERGERVIVTKHGRPIAKIIATTEPSAKGGIDWDHLEKVRKKLGFDKLPPDTRTEEEWFADFNDPMFTRMMLGEDDDRAID